MKNKTPRAYPETFFAKIFTRSIILVMAVVFLASFVSAIPQTFNIHGKLSNSSGALSGTYDMNFSLYNAYTGGSALWTEKYSVATDSDGVYNIILKNVDLPFSAQYYLGVIVESDAEMTPRVNLTSSGYAFRANVSDYLESSRNYEMANLTLGQKITFAFNEIIDNIVDGWIRITGGLNVTGDVEVGGNLSMNSKYIHDLADGVAAQDAVTKSQLDNAAGSGLSGSGTMNTITKWTGSDSLGNSKITDDGTIFAVDSYDLYINMTSDKVGVGTATPVGALNVLGDANITANISTPKLCLDGDCQTTWPSVSGEGGWNDTGSVVELVTSSDNINANTLYIDNVNGNVSIGGNLSMISKYIKDLANGTAAQDAVTKSQLDAVTGSGAETDPKAYNGTLAYLSDILDWSFYNSTDFSIGNYRLLTNLTFNGNSVVNGNFTVDGTDFFVNSNTGRVGIGTTSPNATLHVAGDINVTTGNDVCIDGGACLSTVAGSSETLDGYDSTYFMPLNNSLHGDFDFNGGWGSGGFSIKDGDIYAQTGWFYNISSLSVSNLDINGSLLPYAGFDNQFDIGSSSLRWKNLFIGTNAYIGGVLNVTGNAYIGGNTDAADNASVNSPDIIIRGKYDSNSTAVGIVQATKDFTLRNIITWNSGTGNSRLAFLNDTDAEVLTILESGNTGVGTATPQNKLNVIGDGNFTGNLYVNGEPVGGAGTFVPYTGASSNLDLGANNFTVDGTDFFVNSNTGFVGIGTASPTHKLNVAGDANITGLCVAEDTLLPITRDSIEKLIQIKDVKAGDEVLSLNEETEKIEPRKIKGLLDMGIKPVFNLTTEDGRSIKTTGNHPYLTEDGWTKVSDLKEEDSIAVPKLENSISFVVMPEKNKDDFSALLVDSEFEDKTIHDMDSSFSSQIIPQGFVVVRVENNLFHFFIEDFFEQRIFSGCLINSSLADWQETQGITHFNESKNSSTELYSIGVSFNALFNSSICSGFIGSSSTGCQSINSQNSPSSSVTSLVCLNLSEMSRFINLITAPTKNLEFNFKFSSGELINSINQQSDEDYLNVSKSDIKWVKIKSIEYVGEEQVYDIEVENTHNFIANGIVAHNTYLGDSASDTVTIAGNLSVGENITLGKKITFAFGEIIDNIVNGWIRVVGGLNVTEDAEVGGNLNVSGSLEVAGDIDVTGTISYSKCAEGMAYIDKMGGFCIDKYEASVWNSDGTWNSTSNTSAWNGAAWTDAALAAGAYANSSEGKYPWVRIDRNEARTACANYPGGNKYLCTDEQWLAAADIKGVFYNLAAELTDCTVNEATDCDWTDSPEGGDACMTGSKTDCVSSEGVYDMTGNVWEWTNETVGYTKPCTDPAVNGWCYWNGDAWTTTPNAVFGNDGTYFTAGTNSGKAVLRGGGWSSGAGAGPFCANLGGGPTDTSSGVGFRCCSS